MYIIGLFLSSLIGLSLGLIGGGGSILTVPILVYLIGVEPKEAVGMSLAVVGVTSFFSSFLHYKRGNVDFPAGTLFGISGIIGAFAGSPLTQFVSPGILMLLFAGLMFVVAFSMIWRKSNVDESIVHQSNKVKAILAGFGVGVLTGFLGVGGGFLVVPALVFFGGLTMKKAIGTSLLVIALNCLAGFLGHLNQESFDLKTTALVSILALSGAIGGTILSHKFSAANLQKSFAFLVLAVALFLTYKNISILF
jgi:uncharacterized protein